MVRHPVSLISVAYGLEKQVQSLDHRTILFQTNDNSKTNCQVSKNKRVMSQKLVKSYEKNKIETYYLLLHPIFHFCFIFFTFSYFCTTTILQAFIALPYSLKPLLTMYYSLLQIIFILGCKHVTKPSYQTISCSVKLMLKSCNSFLVRHTFLSPLVKEIDTKKSVPFQAISKHLAPF